ncbi:hypothetical protein GUITHDRAFT_141004 [Guillardia theta CCMP2712]|uniref:Uncharacterized protein n=1 Tax=Guillardia theta (strain CCMP2712) TaxID=905079 RepID=L1J465_GUITC|nr:hypothetical protein GUITHDRAFT_141004 [Guillardia theta CCMP2712]EKX42880.1 hypothetical protein GUITHDRAFT_141004 [Guillardia theta CCMP2712]|eukprot:XP_005829860.1 hypothetical protein GUITHDRAFT_141004 [Guillardia theta CCMP2712]
MEWKDGIAGAISGVATRCCVAPLDVIKIRLQLQTNCQGSSRDYRGFLGTFQVVALWKGNLAAEFLWGGYMGTQFLAYRSLQAQDTRLNDGSKIYHGVLDAFYRILIRLAPSLIQVMPYMGIQFSIYEALKRFISTQTKEGSQGNRIIPLTIDSIVTASQGRKISSMREVVRGILRDEGWQGFFRGGLPSVMKTALSSGLSFAIYELMLKIL